MDISGRGGGKASAWIRMAQPYVGKGYGQHFPLTPGAEVMLTFLDGNPDRPVISGALPNAETGNIVNSSSSALSGLGTKGGSSLMFGEDGGQQKVLLASGSNRGLFSLSAGSPTQAMLMTDVYNNFSASSDSVASIYNSMQAGCEQSIKADQQSMADIKTYLNMATSALSLGQGITDDKTVNDSADSGANCAIAKNALGLGSMLTSSLSTGLRLKEALAQALEDGPLLPHNNLFSVEGGSTGTAAVWRSKTASAVYMAQTLGFINLAAGLGKSAASLASDAKGTDDNIKSDQSVEEAEKQRGQLDQDIQADSDKLSALKAQADQARLNYLKATGAVPIQPGDDIDTSDPEKYNREYSELLTQISQIETDLKYKTDQIDSLNKKIVELSLYKKDTKDRASKILASTTAMGSDLTEIISDLISAFLTYKTIRGQPDVNKGFLIRNSDSYLNVQASGHLALAGTKGPVLLESSPAPITPLLHLGAFESKAPADFLKGEILAKAYAYEEAKAMLLRAELVRAVSEEINLEGGTALIGKSRHVIQLIAEGNKVREDEKDVLLRVLAAAQSLLDDATPETRAETQVALYAEAVNYLEKEAAGAVKAEAAFKNGILIKSKSAAMPVTVQTAAADSPLKLLHGQDQELPAGRKLSLADGAALLQEGENIALSLKSAPSPEAALSVSPECKLTLGPAQAALQLAGGNCLTLAPGDLALSHPTSLKASVASGAGLELSAAGVDVKAGAGEVKVNGILIQLG
jgi:hypothetical protein